jgi:hypothetical protein
VQELAVAIARAPRGSPGPAASSAETATGIAVHARAAPRVRHRPRTRRMRHVFMASVCPPCVQNQAKYAPPPARTHTCRTWRRQPAVESPKKARKGKVAIRTSAQRQQEVVERRSPGAARRTGARSRGAAHLEREPWPCGCSSRGRRDGSRYTGCCGSLARCCWTGGRLAVALLALGGRVARLLRLGRITLLAL